MGHSDSRCTGKKTGRAKRVFDQVFSQFGIMEIAAGKASWGRILEKKDFLRYLDSSAQTVLVFFNIGGRDQNRD